MEKVVEDAATRVSERFGYRFIPWLAVSYVAVCVQLFLSILTQYQRKDFMTVTACALALMLLTMPNIARRKEFRMVVLLIFVSIVYDVLWFMINNDVDDDDDGGVEKGVKRFARNISYISFVWKIIFGIIFWKVSLDYLAIVKQTQTTTPFSKREQQVAEINEMYNDDSNYVHDLNIPRNKGEFFLLIMDEEQGIY
jgi:hypothetical protein